jgi:quinoprotein dehydrogenase-associated probable ABC transporter substrate-binding protein
MSFRCLSLAALLAIPPAWASELRVCAEPDNLPYSHADESGFENRIARVLAAELNATLRYTWFLQRRAFVRKTAGLCEVFIGVPSDFERLATTRPYYRSTYVFVHRKDIAAPSFDGDLKSLRIGVQLPGNDLAATPPGHALARRGAIDNVTGFPVYGERPAAERIVDAIARGELDAAVVWGPAAAHFAHRRELLVQPASPPPGLEVPFDFAIAVGIRRGNHELRDALDGALERRKRDIDAILDEYRVPRL